MRGHLGCGAQRWPCTRGDACDGYSWTTAYPMDTMASDLAAHIQEKVLCQWGRLQVPFTHVRPHRTRTCRSARCPPRAPSGHRVRPIRTQRHEMCVQLLPTKPQYSTGWYASQWQAIGQLYTCTNHHYGAWARRAHEGPCGGYVGLASKPKLQGR